MVDISDIELRRLDLTLLMVLDGALRHRKLTTVAQQLGLTQPAISHALTRLRDILRDPLFVRRAELPPRLPLHGLRSRANGAGQRVNRPHPRPARPQRTLPAAHADGGGLRGAGAAGSSDHRTQAGPGALP